MGIIWDGEMENNREQKILVLSVLLAREAFTVIRNLGVGRGGLYDSENRSFKNLDICDLRQRLNPAGQLAEALHNLPTGRSMDDVAFTVRCMERFLLLNPQYADGRYYFRAYLDEIRALVPDIDDLVFGNDE
ncbi:hypothetical protein [Neisseria chenwenguii]|nr:hypothetical protein [Neisseria chenwenguii]